MGTTTRTRFGRKEAGKLEVKEPNQQGKNNNKTYERERKRERKGRETERDRSREETGRRTRKENNSCFSASLLLLSLLLMMGIEGNSSLQLRQSMILTPKRNPV